MIIYLFSFGISCLFIFLAQKNFDKNRKILGVLASIIAILIPTILAGLRDISVGYDIKLYGLNQFQLAVNSTSFSNFLNVCDTDFGYALINYIVSRFTDNINIFLFTINFIIVVLIYLSAYHNRNKVPMWMYMFVFYMMIYNITLNILRQSIAVAIIIYSLKYAEEKKLIKFIVGVIIAMLFHSTAIIALPIYFIFMVEGSKRINIYRLIILGILVIFILNFFNIIEGAVNIGLISAKFLSYVDVYSENATDFGYIDGVTRIIFLLICLFTYKEKIKYNERNKTYIFLLIIDFILMQLTSISGSAQRLAYYYGFPTLLIMIPQMSIGFKKRAGNTELVTFCVLSILIAYWYLKFIYQDFGSTYPYTSNILGIM